MKVRNNKTSLSILHLPASTRPRPQRQDPITAILPCHSSTRFILQAICALFLFAPSVLLCEAFAQEIVVNSSLADKENIQLNVLRAIFSMRLRTWPDGTPVKVFVLEDDKDLHVKFAKKKLDIYPHQLRYSWDRLVYSGTGQAPTQVHSNKEMLQKVASTPGAIGYLPEDMVNNKVHVLNIKTP